MNRKLQSYCCSGNTAKYLDQMLIEKPQPKLKKKGRKKRDPFLDENYSMCNEAIMKLAAIGIPVDLIEHLEPKARYQLIAEAVNWAAKVFDPDFYQYKPYLIAQAIGHGAAAGWKIEATGARILFLSTKRAGTSTFHDYNGVLADFIETKTTFTLTRWRSPWSRVPRQQLSFSLLAHPELLSRVAKLTEIGKIATQKEIQSILPSGH